MACPYLKVMNIWLKTSACRTSSRTNPSLPTITQSRNKYDDSEGSSQEDHLYQTHQLVNYYELPLSATRNVIVEENIDDDPRVTEEAPLQRPRITENSRKSVRFSETLEKSANSLRSEKLVETEANNDDADNSLSEVPTHYIFDKDSRLKFKHIKKHAVDSSNRQESSEYLKKETPNSAYTFFDSQQSLSRQVSNPKKYVSHIVPNTNSNSFSNRRLPSSIKPTENEAMRRNLAESSSRSNRFALQSSEIEERSVPLSRREVSAGKTTGRNNLQEHIISIIEYCSNEVGLAVYNTTNGEIYLCQIIERLTYFRTISTIRRFLPQEIIYSASLEHTPLIKQLLLQFRNIAFKSYKRMMFDETKGFNIYNQRGNKDDYNPDNKFIAYSALNALIFYLQNSYETKFNYSSLNIKWHLVEDLLIIESQTIAELEIFLNAETNQKNGCFVENFHCLTHGGTRMLRANLLQPLANEAKIKERQQLLALLLEDKALHEILRSEVQKFKNFEIITAKFIQSPRENNMKSLKSYISAIYTLSHLSLLLIKFRQKVEPYVVRKPPILAKLLNLISNPKIAQLKEFIESHFDEEVLKTFDSSRPTKRENFIFLLKGEKIEDDFIDILRVTYSHTTEDIFRIFKKIKQKSGTDLKLQNSEFRGYYIKSNKKINLSNLSEKIEDDIIQITEKKDSILFSTTILLSLNNRLKESEKKLILLCENLLRDIIFEIQKNIDVLFDINYEISVLDMILSFAGFVKKYQGIKFTQPVIDNGSTSFAVQQLKTVWTQQAKNKISNPVDLTISKHKKAVVIQKQDNSFEQLNLLYAVGYLTILTQAGCFVPASSFTTDLYKTVLSKIQLSESIESNLSHFQTELHHFKGILDNSAHHNSNCLILLNELIKGTQYEEQISLSQALLTHLLHVRGKSFILISDRYQLNLMIKISSLPALMDPSASQQQTSRAIQRIRRGKTAEEEDRQSANPLQFVLMKGETNLSQILESLNFSGEFMKSFRGLMVEKRQKGIFY